MRRVDERDDETARRRLRSSSLSIGIASAIIALAAVMSFALDGTDGPSARRPHPILAIDGSIRPPLPVTGKGA